MTLEEIIEAANRQYYEEDSKQEQKEEELSEEAKENFKLRIEYIEKQIAEEKEFIENYKENKSNAFKKSTTQKVEDKSTKKESGYTNFWSSSSNSRKKSNFFETLDEELIDLINEMIDPIIKRNLNIMESEDEDECIWDILDFQLEFNRRNKKRERYYQETEEDIKNKKEINKITKKCERKINICEALNFFKVNIFDK